MRHLFIYGMCVLLVVNVKAQLRGASIMFPQPLVPVGSQLNNPFWTGSGMLRGRLNNAFSPQRRWNNFGQWPQTWDTQNTWNNGISSTGNRRNNFNNNGLVSTDPWEQYRRFRSGVRSLTDSTGTSNGISTDTVASQNQLTQSAVNNNNPWNTFTSQNSLMDSFTTQNNQLNTIATPNNPFNTFATPNSPLNTFVAQNNFNRNIPVGINGVNQGYVNQGFVNPQLQPNNQFQNQPFLSQGFPNRVPGVFV